jgi:hypothetical protein
VLAFDFVKASKYLGLFFIPTNQKLTPCCQEYRSYGCKIKAKALLVTTKDNQSHSNPSPDLSLLDS